MNYFFLGKEKISFQDVLERSAVDFSTDDYAIAAITFLQDWLSGKETFEIQSSGSTGMPKKMLVSRSQMEESAKATISYLHLKEGMKALLCIHPSFIGGKMMIVRAQLSGMELHIYPPNLDFSHLEDRYDFTALVPLQVEKLTPYPGIFESLGTVIIGGAAISPPLCNWICQRQNPTFATYGMTETLSHIALQRLNGRKPSPYFEVLPQVKIGKDERDCLWIESPVTQNQRIQTNDVVEIIENRYLKILGRADFVINSGGIKVHPEVLEEVVKSEIEENFPGLQFFIAGLDDEKLGQKISMIVEGKIPENLHALVEKKLKGYQKIKTFVSIPKFIMTESGKINRQESLKLLDHA